MEPDQSRDTVRFKPIGAAARVRRKSERLSLTVVATEIACWACEENGAGRTGCEWLYSMRSLWTGVPSFFARPAERYDQDYFDQYSGVPTPNWSHTVATKPGFDSSSSREAGWKATGCWRSDQRPVTSSTRPAGPVGARSVWNHPVRSPDSTRGTWSRGQNRICRGR